MAKFRVIEPHADDAFLSLGGHIKRWIENGHDVEIVTVYSTPKRSAEAAAYASYVGATHKWLGYTESGSMDTSDGEVEQITEVPSLTDKALITIIPLGLRHTEHFAVRDAWEDARLKTDLLWYYVDQPYAMQLKNQDQLHTECYGKKIVSIFKPGGRKYSKKAVGFFKTQSLFFFYNKDILPHTIETILK